MVIKIEGRKAKDLEKRLDRIGPKAYMLAEFAIGTNPKAMVTGNVLEDEKVLGTCHIAIGNNVSFGESNDVPVHLDGIISRPTVIVGSRTILENGNALF